MDAAENDISITLAEEQEAPLSAEESAARRHDPTHQLELCTRAVMIKALGHWALSNCSHALGELECLARVSTEPVPDKTLEDFAVSNVRTNRRVLELVASLENYMHGKHPEKSKIMKLAEAVHGTSQESAA